TCALPIYARGLAKRLRDDFSQLLLHFARQPADCPVIEPIRNPALLSLFQPIDSALLLVEVSRILNLSFDRLKLVANFRRKMNRSRINRRNIKRRGRRVRGGVSFKKPGHEIPEDRRQLLDGDLGPLQQLSQRLPQRGGEVLYACSVVSKSGRTALDWDGAEPRHHTCLSPREQTPLDLLRH